MVVLENDEFAVINKPPFISTLQDRNSQTNILSLAKKNWTEAKVCHRLDKETSGLLIIAKSESCYKEFSNLFTKREVHKLYYAVVDGRHELEDEEVDLPLFSSSNKSRVDYESGKPSVTLVSTVNIFKNHSLLACMPFTGRMHQIRVHLAAIGFPICGDSIYGGRPIYLSKIKRNFKIRKSEEEQPLMSRLSLHAYALKFSFAGQEFSVKAEYPKDFRATINQLNKNT